jgi:hypothetical protein
MSIPPASLANLPNLSPPETDVRISIVGVCTSLELTMSTSMYTDEGLMTYLKILY